MIGSRTVVIGVGHRLDRDPGGHVVNKAELVAALMERLSALAQMAERTSAGPVRRAMGNLRVVLQGRLAQGEVDADTLHQVAEIIDEAARRIERL